jgi:uncharacterized protein YpuA (DUF1002 family)
MKELREQLREQGYIIQLWHKSDIVSLAKEKEVELNEEQINKIANELENIDANLGINWNTISDLINDHS